MEGKVVRQGQSKTGTSYVIRYPKANDAESAWRYINRLSQEKTFIRFQGEQISFEDEKKYIVNKLKEIEEKKGIILFLEVNDEIHGICNLDLQDRTESHVALLGLSVDQTVRGQGLGKALIETSISEARTHLPGLKIITLAVKSPNAIAIKLYEKFGFKQYGYLPKGTTHRGKLVDEFLMYLNV